MDAKRLAHKLRTRCLQEFGDSKSNLSDIVIGSLGLGSEGDWTFPISEYDARANIRRTTWTCYIHVSKDLDVFVEEAHGKVPQNILACALGGR